MYNFRKIKNDLIYAIEQNKEKLYISVPEHYQFEGFVNIYGRKFKFEINWEVTEVPGYVDLNNGDYYTPSSYEIRGNFDFKLTGIYVFDKNNKEICDAMDFLSDKEVEKIKSLFKYNEEDWADEEYEFPERDWDAEIKDRKTWMNENKKSNRNMKNKIKINEAQLKRIIKESTKKVLKEETSNKETIYKWKHLKELIGADTMLDCIFHWSSSNQIEQYIEWFEEEGYLNEYGF